MDPITHALAGATVAWVVAGRHVGTRSLVIGAAAGLLPDVDVVIRSASDPLLAIEHHRGFTHSLLFVPPGGAISALPFMRGIDGIGKRWSVAAGILAYLTHPLLDAATTYGTQLFWPFSNYRVGLDIISIIDPIFTAIVLIGLMAALKRRRRIVLAVLVAAVAWLGLGGVQRERASAAQRNIARSRGDSLDRGAVFPTIGNTIVWRSIYAADGVLRMDRIRVPWLGRATYAPSDSVPPVPPAASPGENDRIRRDLARFAWFSDGWLARAPSDLSIIGDARYSLSVDRYEPVWGVRFHPGRHPPTEWVNLTRQRKVDAKTMWRDIIGRSPKFVPID